MNTEIEIPVAQLKSVLPGLSKIVSRSTNLPVLQCVKVSLGEDARAVTLQAHNLAEIATVRLDSKANGPAGEVLVPWRTLGEIIKGCPTGESIRLIASEGQTKISYPVAGNFLYRQLTHTPVQEWPAVKVIDREPASLADAAKVALRQAMECASLDSSRHVLNGVCLDVRDKDAHHLVGTDGRHLFCANSLTFNLPEPLIIPLSKFLAWPAFAADGTWQLRMLPAVKPDEQKKNPAGNTGEPPWFQIDSDHWSYVARAIEGQYPNWQQVLPTDTSRWTCITLPGPAVDSLLRALPLLPGNEELSQPVTLTAGKGLWVRARVTDQLDSTRMIVPQAMVQGPSVETTLNRAYLLRALRFGLNRIEVRESLGPLIFTAPGKKMIVMPLRMNERVESRPKHKIDSSQTENAAAAPPSATPVPNPTDQEKPVSTETSITTLKRGDLAAHTNGANGQEHTEEARPGFKVVVEHIDQIKASLRDIIVELNGTAALLKTADKEQRATAKEVEAIRSKLREIQNVEI